MIYVILMEIYDMGIFVKYKCSSLYTLKMQFHNPVCTEQQGILHEVVLGKLEANYVQICVYQFY